MAETWKKIIAAQHSEQENQAKLALEAAKKELELQQRLDERSAEEHSQKLLISREKLKKIVTMRGIIVPMLEDVRNSSPEIRKAPISRVIVTDHDESPGNEGENIELQWGKKLDLTSNESGILQKYEYRVTALDDLAGRLAAGRIPNHIDGRDYSYITLKIDHYDPSAISVFQGNDTYHSYEDFLRNPGCIIPDLARAFQHPSIVKEKYIKGKNYWKKYVSSPDRTNYSQY